MGYVIVVESPKDFIFMTKCGIKNVVATLGLGIRINQENILIDMGIHSIKFLLDNDLAGLDYYKTCRFKRTSDLFNTEILTTKLPFQKDPDQLTEVELAKIFS